jgi:hypothetical protein
MDRARVLRTVESLIRLAYDRRDSPEGEVALCRANEWVQRHDVRTSQISRGANDLAVKMGMPFARQKKEAFTNSPPRSSRSQYTRSWGEWMTHRKFVDQGVCAWCGAPFRRGKWHQGNRARYCNPTCHEEMRRKDARERMKALRQRRRCDV